MATATIQSKGLTPEIAKAVREMGVVIVEGRGNVFTLVADTKTTSPEALAGLLKKLTEIGYHSNEIAVTFGDQPSLLRQGEEGCSCGGNCSCGGH
jgi:hypothetical protein